MNFVQPLQDALSTFLSYLPQLLSAVVILIVGFLIAKALQAVTGRVLQRIGFDRCMERGGIKQFFDKTRTNQTPASLLSRLVFWLVLWLRLRWRRTPSAYRRPRRSSPNSSPTSPISWPPF